MWVSKKFSDHRVIEREGTAADMGVTTIGGKSVSVMARGEQRDLEVFSPGGLIWQPQVGDTVLVIKGGVGCQEQCVVASENGTKAPADMAPGELYLYSNGGASIFLRADGSIEVSGPVNLEGNLQVRGAVKLVGRVDIEGSLYVNGIPYRPCLCS